MSRSLPPNVYTLIVTEEVQAQNNHVTEIKANIANANNLMRHKVLAAISTTDPTTARSVDKILDQPT